MAGSRGDAGIAEKATTKGITGFTEDINSLSCRFGNDNQYDNPPPFPQQSLSARLVVCVPFSDATVPLQVTANYKFT